MLNGVNSLAFTKTMAFHTSSKKVRDLYLRVTNHAVYHRQNRLSGHFFTDTDTQNSSSAVLRKF